MQRPMDVTIHGKAASLTWKNQNQKGFLILLPNNTKIRY
jgi:hypothetical protein